MRIAASLLLALPALVARPLAEMKRPLVREGDQYPLGALLAEGRRNALRADLGLSRSESIRAALPAGPVTFVRLSAEEPARSAMSCNEHWLTTAFDRMRYCRP